MTNLSRESRLKLLADSVTFSSFTSPPNNRKLTNFKLSSSKRWMYFDDDVDNSTILRASNVLIWSKKMLPTVEDTGQLIDRRLETRSLIPVIPANIFLFS
jgi:hypothetical protein